MEAKRSETQQPRTLRDKIIGYGYPIALALLTFFGVAKGGCVRRKGYVWYMLLTVVPGWIWCLWALKQNAWEFHFWNVTGHHILWMTVEDWAICLICPHLFWWWWHWLRRRTCA